MAGFYYTQSGYPLYNSQASSTLEKAEFLAVQAGFDKLPTPTGFPNALVKVRADQTGLDLTTATISATGALAGITGISSASGTWDLTGATAFRVPTATAGDNSTKAASTAFVATSFAPLASPILTGVPQAPTAVAGTNTDQIATTAFVTNQVLTATLPGQTGNSGKFLTTNGTTASWGAAQAPLVSGTNIKTVNGNSLLGSGDVTIASAGGDVVGPAASIDSELVLFSGTTGKLVKRSAASGLVKLTSGVVGTATAGTDYQAAITATGLLKGSGLGSVSAAVSGTDYVAPDANGNVGIGVTPSAWSSAARAIDVHPSGGSLFSFDKNTGIASNGYYNGTNWLYKNTGYATRYESNLGGTTGSHAWFVAASGTAGAVVPFTQAMSLDASGNLNIANLTASKVVFTDAGKNLTSTGTVGVAQGGTGATTLTGLVKGNGTSAFTAATANTDYLAPALANTAVSGFKTATFNSQSVIATTTGAITIDWTAAQNQKQTEPTGAITYTFTAPPGPCHCQLLIDSDGVSTAQTITWPGSVIWLGTTWAGVANKKAIINFWYDGTNYYAMGSNQV